MELDIDLKSYVRNIPDFPKEGILFRDITPILRNPEIFKLINEIFYQKANELIVKPTAIVAIESRGFIFGSILADRMKLPLVLIRKENKLPHIIFKEQANAEYSDSSLEIHQEDLDSNDNVIIIDDVLAMGGTFDAAIKLVSACGAKVINLFTLMNLNLKPEFKDQKNLFSIINY
jgi:adenine phosphoribosyltransferase